MLPACLSTTHDKSIVITTVKDFNKKLSIANNEVKFSENILSLAKYFKIPLPQKVKSLDENAIQSLSKLETLINEMPVCKINLAFNPDESISKYIASIISEKIGRDVIVDVEFKPSIIAGAEIMYNGRYVNLTLKQNLEQEIMKTVAKYV